MKRGKEALTGVVFALALLAGGLWFLLAPKADYSEAERRPLAAAPAPSASSILDGSYFTGLNGWITDRFPARESWRRLKALWQLKVLREAENNGLVLAHGSLVKLERQVSGESLAYAGERLGAFYDRYLAGTDCRVYAAVIPDKSVFLADEGFPVMDFSEMEAAFWAALPAARPIPLADTLTLDDYYRTDSHWRQERLFPAAERLLCTMGAAGPRPETDFVRGEYAPFSGVYAGQSALRPEPETLIYLTGSYLDAVRVRDLATNSLLPVYDPAGCDARDPYTLFLGGARALLRIENPNADTDRELVLIRDSFGSSLAPLLAGSYRAVTLADLRYLQPEAAGRYLRFTDQDVLFLFSATLLNNSQGLR